VTPRRAVTLEESDSRRALFWRSRSYASDMVTAVVDGFWRVEEDMRVSSSLCLLGRLRITRVLSSRGLESPSSSSTAPLLKNVKSVSKGEGVVVEAGCAREEFRSGSFEGRYWLPVARRK
jgi:hypothetical protein